MSLRVSENRQVYLDGQIYCGGDELPDSKVDEITVSIWRAWRLIEDDQPTVVAATPTAGPDAEFAH